MAKNKVSASLIDDFKIVIGILRRGVRYKNRKDVDTAMRRAEVLPVEDMPVELLEDFRYFSAEAKELERVFLTS